MGCLNGKLLTNRANPASATVTDRNNSDLYPKHDDSVNSSSPDEDKLLQEQRLGNGTNKFDGGKIRGPKKSKYKKAKKEKDTSSSSNDDCQTSSAGLGPLGKFTANGGGGGLFGRRLGSNVSSRNVDGTGSTNSTSGQQNGSILHSLGTLLENGGRNSSSSPRISNSPHQRNGDGDSESNPDSPLTPDRLHKNFQDRLLTSQVSRNNQKLTDSQLEFFRMLDEKIAQGREDDSWEAQSANTS